MQVRENGETVQISVSSKGQVVLPRVVRERLAIDRGTVLDVELCEDGVKLRRGDRGKHTSRSWKGVLKGTSAVQDHLKEHRDEVEHHP